MATARVAAYQWRRSIRGRRREEFPNKWYLGKIQCDRRFEAARSGSPIQLAARMHPPVSVVGYRRRRSGTWPMGNSGVSDWSDRYPLIAKKAAFNCSTVKNYALDPGYHSCDDHSPNGLHRLANLRPVPYRLGRRDTKFRCVAGIDRSSIPARLVGSTVGKCQSQKTHRQVSGFNRAQRKSCNCWGRGHDR